MRPRETYSAEYHTTHDFDLPINHTVFSRKKNQKTFTTKHTQQIFFHAPFACNQYVLNKIIALNFVSKTKDSEQLITKNPQRKKKKKKKYKLMSDQQKLTNYS
jgi:hypothetical protein